MTTVRILLTPDYDEECLYIYILKAGVRSGLVASYMHNVAGVLSLLYDYSQELNVTIEVYYDNGRIEHLATLLPIQVRKGTMSYSQPNITPFQHQILECIAYEEGVAKRLQEKRTRKQGESNEHTITNNR